MSTPTPTPISSPVPAPNPVPKHRTTFIRNTQLYLCPQTRMAEITSAGFALWWTILLLLPVHLFASNLVFLGLQRMGSEHGWVLWTAATFAVQIYGWRNGDPVVRWAGCMLSGLLWMFVATGISIGSHKWHVVIPVNTGVAAYGITSIKNLYCAAFVLPKYCLPQVYAAHKNGMTHIYSYINSAKTLRQRVKRRTKGE